MADDDAAAFDFLGRKQPLSPRRLSLSLAAPGGGVAGGGSAGGGAGVTALRVPSVDQRLQSAARDVVDIVNPRSAVTDLLPPDPSGSDTGGVAAGGPAPTGPSDTNITGFDPGLVGQGLTAASLATGVPGIAGTIGALTGAATGTTAVPNVGTALFGAKSINALADFLGLRGSLTNTQGKSFAPLTTGLIDSLRNAFTGKANFAEVSNEIASLLADNPGLLNDPETMAVISQAMELVSPSLTPGVAMDPSTFGATNIPGQVGFQGAPGGPASLGGTSSPSVFGSDPNTSFNLAAAGRGDEDFDPTAGVQAGGPGGNSGGAPGPGVGGTPGGSVGGEA